jgi:hypothetical protein
MKLFAIKIFLFFTLFISFSFIPRIALYDNAGINFNSFVSRSFLSKIQSFEKFIKNKKAINLIIGSSEIRDGLVPSQLSEKWYSFANGGQNIDNSLQFLKYYNDKAIIDTLLISLHPFDFVNSYYMKDIEKGYRPFSNHNFSLFSKDLLKSSFFDENPFKKKLQSFFNQLFINVPTVYNMFYNKGASNQGYNSNIRQNHGKLSELFSDNLPNTDNYFINVEADFNKDFIDKFDNYCKKRNIIVFYIFMPKSKYYLKALKNTKHYYNWQLIKDYINNNYKHVADIENYYDGFHDEDAIFYDDVHLTHFGASEITNFIRKQLTNEK